MTKIKRSPEANALDGKSATTRAGLARDPGTQAVHRRHQHRQSPSGLKRAGISTWRHFHSYCFLSHPSHQLWDVLPHFLGHKCPKSRSHICLVHHMVHCPSNSRGSRHWSGNEWLDGIKSSLSSLTTLNLPPPLLWGISQPHGGNGQGRGHPHIWGAVIYHLKTVSALPNCWHETPMAGTM